MAKQKIGIIIQARMASTRFLGKNLMLLNEKDTVLEILIKRLKLCKLNDEIIIATTPDEKNLLILKVAKKNYILYFVRDEENVLERFFEAAKKYNLDIIVRITSDCPFVDPKLLDEMINFFINNNYDYIMNLDEVSNFPEGFDVEIFSFEILKKIFNLVKTDYEREHVTIFIRNHPEMFSIFHYNKENLKFFKDLRLTLDFREDLEILREVYHLLKKKGKGIDFSLQDVLDIIDEHPEIMDINKHLK